AVDPAVTLKPPPWIVRILNPVMRMAIRSRVGRRMEPLAVLRFTGRRSGKQRDIPVGLHSINGRMTVFTDRPWRMNFEGGTDVLVMHGGRTESGRATLIEDRALVGPALKIAVDQAGPRNLGLAVGAGCVP